MQRRFGGDQRFHAVCKPSQHEVAIPPVAYKKPSGDITSPLGHTLKLLSYKNMLPARVSFPLSDAAFLFCSSFVQRRLDLLFYFFRQLNVVGQQALECIASLAESGFPIAEPRTTLFDDFQFDA